MSSAVYNRVMEIEFPAEPRVVHDVRQKFEEFVQPCRLNRDDIETIKVALSEACSNAVCHGSPGGAGNRVHVRYEINGHRLVIEIRDQGPGFRPRQIELPRSEEYRPNGRGLFIMQALMDEVEFDVTPKGTRVRLVKHLPELEGERLGNGLSEPMRDSDGFFSRLQPVGYAESA